MFEFGGHRPDQDVQPLTRHGADGKDRTTGLPRQRLADGGGLVQFTLAHHDNLRPLPERRVIQLQFLANRPIIFQRVAAIHRCRLDHMHEEPGPFDVPQKLMAEPHSGVGPLDQTRQVCEYETAIAIDRHNP